jgi:predicted metal-dependent peptidase
MKDILLRAIVNLYDSERFYAELVLGMDRIVTDKVPTAGVSIRDRVTLLINPKFFETLTMDQQVAVLKHECQHILNDHIPRIKECAPEALDEKDPTKYRGRREILNIAADLSINPGIPNVPACGVMPYHFNLKDGKTLEWYVDKLLKSAKDPSECEGYDDHASWDESEGSKEEIQEKCKQHVNEAARAARNAGKMTADDELTVERLNYKPRDWKSDLRRFAARALSTLRDTSRKKRNRRYGITCPGYIKEDRLHIGVAIDTSGSVSDEALGQFMAEIGNIAKYAQVTVVQADAEVKDACIYDPKKNYKIKGRGGTAYQPAFNYFTEETDVDGVIYFGDMDTSDAPTKPKYPVLWAVVGKQNPPALWGSKTFIEIKSKK